MLPTEHNRESWLTRAAALIADWYRAHGFDAKDVRVSCGWPIEVPYKCMGEVWEPDVSPDGHHHMFVNPILSDSITVLGVLAHEVAHTINMRVNHRGVFLKAVRAIGLVGPGEGSEAGAKFHPLANEIIDTLGQYPFKGLNITWKNKRRRVVSVYACTGCGYTAMIPRKYAKRDDAHIRCAMKDCHIYHTPMRFEKEARI